MCPKSALVRELNKYTIYKYKMPNYAEMFQHNQGDQI